MSRTFTNSLVIAVFLASTYTAVPHALSQPTDAESTALARALFREGVTFVDAEQWDEAADRFRRAHALRPSPALGYNLAAVLARQAHLVEASELLRSVLRDTAIDPVVRSDAEILLAQIEPRIGRLAVHLTGESSDVEVRLDGRPLAAEAIGMSMPADPGPHHVQAFRAGVAVASGETIVLEGAAAEIAIVVPAAPVSTPEPLQIAAPLPREDPPTPLRRRVLDRADPSPSLLTSPWLWIAVGVLVAGSAVGVVLASGGDPPAIGGDLAVVEFHGR